MLSEQRSESIEIPAALMDQCRRVAEASGMSAREVVTTAVKKGLMLTDVEGAMQLPPVLVEKCRSLADASGLTVDEVISLALQKGLPAAESTIGIVKAPGKLHGSED